MTTLVDQLIQAAQTAEEQRKAELKHKIETTVKEAVKTATALLEEAGLSEFMEAIHPCVEQPAWKYIVHRDQVNRLTLHVNLCDELQLDEFYIIFSLSQEKLIFNRKSATDGRTYSPDFEIIAPNRRAIPDATIDQEEVTKRLGVFLENRRQAYAKAKEQQLKREELNHRNKVSNTWQALNDHKQTDPEAAKPLCQQLEQLGETEDASELFADWKKKHQEWQEEQEMKQRLHNQVDEYRDALFDWMDKCDEVRAQNRRALEALQEKWNTPRQRWRLWYGVIAHEENEAYVEERSIICDVGYDLPPEINNGTVCVLVTDGPGAFKKQWVYTPTRITKVECRPTDKQFYQKARLNVSSASFTFYIHLGSQPDKILAEAKALIQQLPPKPEPGDLLSENDVEYIEDYVRHANRGY